MWNKDSSSIYFSHIPRTGGRYLRKILSRNDYILDEKYINRIDTSINQEVMHYSYNYAKRIDSRINRVTKITIIRNPINRFISACNSELSMKWYFHDDIAQLEKLEDYNYFLYYMDNKMFTTRIDAYDRNKTAKVKGLKNYSNNWFRRQLDFFDSSFWIWKHENGLGKNLRFFLANDVGLDIDINKDIPRNISNIPYDIKIPGFSLSEKLRRNVIKYYEEDYDFWNEFKQ